jgi:hypothetical protein
MESDDRVERTLRPVGAVICEQDVLHVVAFAY